MYDNQSRRKVINHTHWPTAVSSSAVIGPQQFKDAMAKLAFSTAVVTARQSDELVGRTVTSFMPLSADPARIVISINVGSRIIDFIGGSSRFSVSFLSHGQQSIGDAFAGKVEAKDRFLLSQWDYWPTGTPRLADAIVSIDCEMVGSLDVGDHMLFVGDIVDVATSDVWKPLLWSARRYSHPVD